MGSSDFCGYLVVAVFESFWLKFVNYVKVELDDDKARL